jgi:quinol monooxygenase YgiN
MLKVVAKLTLTDAAKDTVIELARELVEKTRLEEGNISYGLYAEAGNPDALAFIEEWESKEALDAHMASEHFTGIFPLLASHTVGQEISVFTPIL